MKSDVCYSRERGESVGEYEYILLNREMSERLGIGVSTLRKWAAALEKSGYGWEKNEDGTRYFTRYDEETLILFKTLVQEQKFNLEQAAKIIVSRRQGGRSSERTGDALQEIDWESPSETRSDTRSLVPVTASSQVPITRDDIQFIKEYVTEQNGLTLHLMEEIQELKEERKEDKELIRELVKQLQAREERDIAGEERGKQMQEQVNALLSKVSEMEEKQTQREVAAAIEAANTTKPKKGFISKLLGK